MTITAGELKGVLLEIGMRKEIVEAIVPGKPLLKQGLDSADFPAFSLLIEDRYGVGLGEEDALTLRSLDDFAAYVNARKG